MSVESIALVLHHSEAEGTAKVVLIGIANHDGDGGAWPGIDTLVKYARKSERTVQYAIRTLVELGELAVHQNEGGTHGTRADRRPNRYEILVVCPPGCDGSTQHRVQPTAPRDADGVQSSALRGATGCANGVQPTAPEPSPESPGEPGALFDAQSVDGEFEEWWSGWPVKKDKARARSCFHARRREGHSLGGLLRARDAYLASASEHRDYPRYVKHGATFLAKGPDAPWIEWLDGDPDLGDDDPGTTTQQLARAQWGEGSRS